VTLCKPFNASGQVTPVPKVAVTKDGHPSCREDNVRTARQVSYVYPVSKCSAVKRAAQKQLAARVSLCA
jgi:hypothetical protein